MNPVVLRYSEAIEVAASGAGLRQIADALGVSLTQYRRVLAKDPIFAEAIRQARELGFTIRAESLRTIVYDDPFGDPHRTRVILDLEKWLLSKLHPKVFGDRIDITISEKPDVAGAMQEARERVKRIVDITPHNVALPIVPESVECDPFA